jgi:uncharacterized protein (DUF4415 family)
MHAVAKKDDDPASRPDDDNPEWTMKEIRKARPALEVIAEVFGPHVADGLRRRPARPVKADKKVSQNLRLDPDVLEAYQQAGKGWQTKINQVLRDHMPGP